MDSIIYDTDGCQIRRIPVYLTGIAPSIRHIPTFKEN